MALTDDELTFLAKELAERIFVRSNVLAHSSAGTLKASIQAIDQGMSATTNQVQSLYPNTVLKLALLNHIKSVAPNLTTQQAGITLALWALREVGLI